MSTVIVPIPQRSDYGAFEIKKYITISTRNGLIASILLLLIMFGSYKINEAIEEARKARDLAAAKMQIVDIPPPPVDDAAPPPPVEEVIQDLGTTVIAGTPNPVEDSQVTEDIFASVDEMSKALSTKGDIDISNLDLGNIDLDAKRGDVNVGNTQEKELDPDDFIAVEKEAVVDYADLQKSVEYPELAKRAGIQGTVVVQVLIGADGRPKKTRILSTDNKMLNENAVKAISEFKGFKPAIQNKQPVATWMSIPIKFRLN